MDSIKKDIENFLQFALFLIQLIGLFVVKPDMFDLYHQNHPFLAGNPAIYFMLLVSIAFILLSLTFNKPNQIKYWLIAAILCVGGFVFNFYRYNEDLANKTFLASSPNGVDPVRVIKGDTYWETISKCAIFKNGRDRVREIDVIQQCANITGWSQLDEIWPGEQIIANTKRLLNDYYLCLIFGSISLIGGVQAIKCLRNKTQP
jgi:hypothetical protein